MELERKRGFLEEKHKRLARGGKNRTERTALYAMS